MTEFQYNGHLKEVQCDARVEFKPLITKLETEGIPFRRIFPYTFEKKLTW